MLDTVSSESGIPINWDWKATYVDRFYNGAGLELFSQFSVTPDTTLLMAGPPRIGVNGFTEMLTPLGLITNYNIQIDNALRPVHELGTSFTYFTRGKAINTLSIGAMVAYKPSLLRLTSRWSPTGGPVATVTNSYSEGETGLTIGTSEFPNDVLGVAWTDADAPTVTRPFGLLVIYKTKNGLAANSTYLENCNIASYGVGMASDDLVVNENVSIMFDRQIDVTVTQGGYSSATGGSGYSVRNDRGQSVPASVPLGEGVNGGLVYGFDEYGRAIYGYNPDGSPIVTPPPEANL
ncbi:hypothetical protein [Endozoicomonas sp. 4G]|uniref:hypothetical protein n=1 Tax=Endozoicomonas sp. 4G TaxID=2872754 RepID=UPI0020790DBF|nr:hypothetical protein [Endozoicomonas sp. 4G]